MRIESFVCFDLETTGLPHQERNRTKITELSLVAASRRDILEADNGVLPPVSKLTLVFNPKRKINPDVVKMNGLSNDLLRHAPLFEDKIVTITSFLQELPKPVCVVAHNGNRFDFKILLAEFNDVNFVVPSDLLCLDSLVAFRQILKDGVQTNIDVNPKNYNPISDDLLTDDDDDEWPILNVSVEDWEDIDSICETLSDISCEDIQDQSHKEKNLEKNYSKLSRADIISKVFNKDGMTDQEKMHDKDMMPDKVRKAGIKVLPGKQSFALGCLYKTLLSTEPKNSHRAEGDCLMLLQCILCMKDAFVEWADRSCKKLTEITPLIRQ